MARSQLLAIEAEMNTRFINRREEIHGLVLCAVSKQHMLMLSPPGAAKTAAEKAFARYISSTLNYDWLFTQFTTPDEVFGPVDIAAMKEGRYSRITTNKLPEAQTAFIDEIFKANSAILNALLSALEERIFHNNGTPQTIPLHFAVGASNELPEDDENLQALYDRFLLRYTTGYLDSETDIEKLLMLDVNKPTIVPPMTMEDLIKDSDEALALPLSADARDSIIMLWGRLREAGFMFSDRRLKKMVQVMAAESWLQDETEITAESLIVAEHIMWDRPDQEREVKSIVRSCVNPGAAKSQELYDASLEAMKGLGFLGMAQAEGKRWDPDIHPTQPQGYQVARHLKFVLQELNEMPSKPIVEQVKVQISQMQVELVGVLTDLGE